MRIGKRFVPGWSVLAGCTVSMALAAQAADWPQWRGPEGNSVSTETNWSPAALQSGAKAEWKTNVGAGYSAVAVRDGLLYTMGHIGRRDIVWCLKAATGELVWTNSYECGPGSYPGPRATPTVSGEDVYTFSREGLVLCLDAKTGAIRWQRKLGADDGVEAPKWGFAGSPCVEGKLLLLNAGDHGTALNRQSGNRVWSSRGTGGYSTPVVFSQDGKRCVALFTAKGICAVDFVTGKEVWSYPWATSYDVNAADPLIMDKTVLISSGYGTGCALLDFSAGMPKLIWQNRNLASQFSSVVLLDGNVYGVDGNVGRGALVCIDPKTGNVKWRQELGFGSLIAANGKLIVLNEAGDLFVAEASPKGYTQVASAPKTLGRTCWTSPVLSDGRLYCRNEKGDLICIMLRP